MDAEDYIEDKTAAIVRSLSDKLAPTCVNCPMAKVFISQEACDEKNSHKLKINLRCDKMGMIGSVCPDRGDPTRRYAKDIGMRRLLSEEQLSYATDLHRFMMRGRSSTDIRMILGGESYMNLLRSKIKGQKEETGERLHTFNEAISYVTQGRPVNIEPILWLGEVGHESLSHAVREVEIKHKLEYQKEVQISTGICEPTTYMKAHLDPDFHRPFGIFVDSEKTKTRAEHDGVQFFGDDPPSVPEIVVPEPTQDELYEDWGVYG